MMRTSAVVWDRTESEATLHRNLKDIKDEDAAFRSHISPLLIKFRDETMERTYQTSLRAHAASYEMTAVQALCSFSMLSIWTLFVLRETRDAVSVALRFAGNSTDVTTNDRRTHMRMGKSACFGPCLSIGDLLTLGLLIATKYATNRSKVMGSTLRFCFMSLCVGLIILFFCWTAITGDLYAGPMRPFAWNALVSSVFRDCRAEKDDPFPASSPNSGLFESRDVVANLVDRYEHDNERCLYNDDGQDVVWGVDDTYEMCAASSYQNMFVAYGYVAANNKISVAMIAMISIYVAIEFVLGEYFHISCYDLVMVWLILINVTYFYVPEQYATATVVDLGLATLPLAVLVRENALSTRRQFYSSWQRTILLEEETAKLSIDSFKMNTELLSAEKRFELLTKVPDVVNQVDERYDAMSATSSKLVNSEQWTLSAKVAGALQRNQDFCSRIDNMWQIDINEISNVRRVKRGAFFDNFRGKYHDKDVMIKRPVLAPEDDDATIDKKLVHFAVEIEVVSGLNHRNVMAMAGACWKDQLFLVLEYPRGGVLAQVTREDPSYVQHHWHNILLDVANGLNFLQSHHRICHRNISMDSIFVHFNGLFIIGELHDCIQYASDGELTSDVPSRHVFDAMHVNELFHVAPEVLRGTTVGTLERDGTCDSYSFGMLAVALCISPSSLRNFVEIAHLNRANQTDLSANLSSSRMGVGESKASDIDGVESTTSDQPSNAGKSNPQPTGFILPSDAVSVDFLIRGWRPQADQMFDGTDGRYSMHEVKRPVVEMVERCWSQNASERPTCAELVRGMYILIGQLQQIISTTEIKRTSSSNSSGYFMSVPVPVD